MKIILHCFTYNKKQAQPFLNQVCTTVYYYPRKRIYAAGILSMPYIVASRYDKELLNNLSNTNAPILFEGLHCTYYLSHPKLAKHLKMVRMHNVEYQYYKHLAIQTSNIIKKGYYAFESYQLKRFERVLVHAQQIFTISPADTNYYQKFYPTTTVYLPAFHGNKTVQSKLGYGSYALYHGNLSVIENQKAAIFLIEQVFSKLPYLLKIAGNNPSKQLLQIAKKYNNIQVINNPSSNYITQLMQQAQVCVLPTFQETGIKLKLINTLFNSRYCLVNMPMVKETPLEALCIIAESASDFCDKIHTIFLHSFTLQQLQVRKAVLLEHFSDTKNIEILLQKCN